MSLQNALQFLPIVRTELGQQAFDHESNSAVSILNGEVINHILSDVSFVELTTQFITSSEQTYEESLNSAMTLHMVFLVNVFNYGEPRP